MCFILKHEDIIIASELAQGISIWIGKSEIMNQDQQSRTTSLYLCFDIVEVNLQRLRDSIKRVSDPQLLDGVKYPGSLATAPSDVARQQHFIVLGEPNSLHICLKCAPGTLERKASTLEVTASLRRCGDCGH